MSGALDLLTMGRSSLDLYSSDIGAPFDEITGFAAFVGGSPTNIAVGARRLGLRSGVLTALGADPVGDFVLRFLRTEGLPVDFIPRKPGKRTSAVVLGIEPPDRFPLVYYRDNCADLEISIDDVLAAPIRECRAYEFAGTNLSREPSRSATLFAAELAQACGATVAFDLDFRPDQWHDVRAYGVAARSALRWVDVVIGTQDELKAALLRDAGGVDAGYSAISDARVMGDSTAAAQALLAAGPRVVIEKRGADGARVHFAGGGAQDVPGFPVEVVNILGAGDAFAAGLLYGHLQGWDWERAARLGNACGAILVTKHGCANFMPTLAEVNAFAAPHGEI